MSTKITPPLQEENPNLRKQIGCINGIFQLFGRHRFLTSSRLCNHNSKKLLPGPNNTVELRNAKPEATEHNGKELPFEKHRTSTESSRISSSSSFSSTDYDSTVQTVRTSSSRHSFAETQAQSMLIQQHKSSAPMANPCFDLREMVKDSMYREPRGLSIKTVGKEGGGSYVMKRIDSPKPLQCSKTSQPKVTGNEGSARAFPKNQEAPWISKQMKDSLLQRGIKEPSRFSCDGREWRDGAKFSIKLKEPPRLSLDGRDIRSPVCEFQSNCLQRVLSGDKGNCSHILNLNQEPSHNNRSSIVTKLMGLEAFPHHASINKDKLVTPQDSTSRSSHSADKCRQNQDPMSLQVLKKAPASPRPSKNNCVKKTTSCSRFPIEHAPWRQKDASRVSHNLAVKSSHVPANTPHASTVYGEIEKRITDLEFKRSGKDLRALKQILEAMQKTRQKLENQIAEESDFQSQTSQCTQENSSCTKDLKSRLWQNHQSNCLAPTIKANRPPNMLESPTISVKPMKLVDKFNTPPPTAADLSPRQKIQTRDAKHNRVDLVDNRITRKQGPMRHNLHDPGWHFLSMDDKKGGKSSIAVQISKETKHMKGEYLTAPAKNSGAKSPRPQQQQCGTDKQSRPNTPLSDLHRARTQSNKTRAESGTPNRKLKVRSTNLQRGDDQISKLNHEMRTCYHQDDTASLQSESNNSLVSQMDTNITSTDCSESDAKQQGECNDNDTAMSLRKDVQMAELRISTTEQPSPVSVLDATFYRDDSPSPVKKVSTAFTESFEAERSPGSLDHRQKIRSLTIGSEDNKMLEDIKDLVHKLQLLSPVSNEASTDCIGSLCTMSSPDHQYITKVLLASGLLKDVSFISTPSQLHSPGHVINPKLFHVLEQTEVKDEPMREGFDGKTVQPKLNRDIHRKILFDTVNEILSCKLRSEYSFLLRRRTQSGQELLKQLHSEVDNLHRLSNCALEDEEDQLLSILTADMTHKMDDWTHHHSEVPALVLDIERLIFKDLISAFINDEKENHQNWQREHCRKLLN